MILTDSCMITHYIMEENIFVVIVYTLSLPKKYENVILNLVLNLIVNKLLRCLKEVDILNQKLLNKKNKIPIYDLCGF